MSDREPDVSEQRAIEAVEAILNRMIDAASRAGADGTLPAETVRVECLRATYALDRVRDARGDGEAAWRGEEHQWDQGSSGVDEAARSVIAGRDPVKLPPADDVWDAPAARSPQGEGSRCGCNELLGGHTDECPQWGEHEAYVQPLGSGYLGFQARCYSCDWQGPEHLRGDEIMGTPESRAHKNAARADALSHRQERNK
jgi:hypothetical protein